MCKSGWHIDRICVSLVDFVCREYVIALIMRNICLEFCNLGASLMDFVCRECVIALMMWY